MKIAFVIVTLVMALASAESVRGGFFADEEEIVQVAKTGKGNGWLNWVMLGASVLFVFLLWLNGGAP